MALPAASLWISGVQLWLLSAAGLPHAWPVGLALAAVLASSQSVHYGPAVCEGESHASGFVPGFRRSRRR